MASTTRPHNDTPPAATRVDVRGPMSTTTRRQGPNRSMPSLHVATVQCDSLAETEPQSLGLTYWFEPRHDGLPYSANVRFAGHCLRITRGLSRHDRFTVWETVATVIPGSGPIAVTTRVPGIAPGPWTVTATMTGGAGLGSVTAHGTTAYEPLLSAGAPGVHLGAWPALVSAGVAVALAVQSLLAARAGLPVSTTLVVSALASLAGLVGAKLYYIAEHRVGRSPGANSIVSAGMCIQGFVIAAMATAGAGMLIAGVSVAHFLDVTAPGLFFGMAIGRIGCFFGGCCAGRPSGSRWALWSSDRRIGTRRVPTQLLESALVLVIGALALLVEMRHQSGAAGAVFVAATAAYTLGRQLLLPLRDLPRKKSNVRIRIAVVAAAVLLADLLVGTLNIHWR